MESMDANHYNLNGHLIQSIVKQISALFQQPTPIKNMQINGTEKKHSKLN